MTSAGQIRSQRLQFLLKLKIAGADDKELLDHAIARYMVTKATAQDYIETVKKAWEKRRH